MVGPDARSSAIWPLGPALPCTGTGEHAGLRHGALTFHHARTAALSGINSPRLRQSVRCYQAAEDGSAVTVDVRLSPARSPPERPDSAAAAMAGRRSTGSHMLVSQLGSMRSIGTSRQIGMVSVLPRTTERLGGSMLGEHRSNQPVSLRMEGCGSEPQVSQAPRAHRPLMRVSRLRVGPAAYLFSDVRRDAPRRPA